QVLNAPKKSSKSLITNEVHLVFDDSLCTSSTCTLKCVSISGFTLIEILIVVVLVSILTVMGVQMLSSGSVERNLQQHGKILQASINYACDQATLQNRVYGVNFFNTGYQFSQLVQQQWVEVSAANLSYREIVDGTLLNLKIDGQTIVLSDDVGESPQLMCAASGQVTPFELILSDATDTHHYQLQTINFWQIQGQWLDAKKN
ncbi:MAG: type II secretion system minor pseudopilin GspH, partial [Proteobacteria bacterium]|nr:type II secretion system minor pseudopilin GspH [Pseudomonadota bacterium]